jgi:hypothetical protein
MKTLCMLAIFAAALVGLTSLIHRPGTALRTDPSSDPDKAAWELFVYINQPSSVNKDIPLWETWSQAARVFANPNAAPQIPIKYSDEFEVSKSIRAELSSNPPNLRDAFQDAQPQLCDGFEDNRAEVMLNDDMVRYIAKKKLYSVEGQIEASQKEEIQFPQESIAVKAAWQPIDPKDASQFYYRKCGHSTYGLVALHIISKRAKDWLWTTFEHTKTDEKHNQLQCKGGSGCIDTFGALPPTGLEHQQAPQLISLLSKLGPKWQPVWSHYRLIGTQVEFTDITNTPTKMGNSVLEQGMIDTSSCITCHSRSTISEDKKRLKIGKIDGTGFIGNKLPCWYLDQTGQVKFYKLDYIWSLSLAKRKNEPTQGADPVSLNCNGEELPLLTSQISTGN